jgi:hypothetical protein
MQPTLVILAAGAGSRYGGLKQLAPMGPNDETLLEYSAFDALRAGFGSIVLIIRPETEELFRARLDDGLATRVSLRYVHQRLDDLPAGHEPPAGRTKPWGTGQAVLAATGAVDGPFAVVNADDFYGAASFATLARFLHQTDDRDCAAVGFRITDTLTDAGAVSRAVLEVDVTNHLRTIAEIRQVWREGDQVVYRDRDGARQRLHGDELVSMNMWGFTPGLLLALERRFAHFLDQPDLTRDAEFLLPEVVQLLVSQGEFRVQLLSGSGDWCGVTFREDERRVRFFLSSLVDRGIYPSHLWAADQPTRKAQ